MSSGQDLLELFQGLPVKLPLPVYLALVLVMEIAYFPVLTTAQADHTPKPVEESHLTTHPAPVESPGEVIDRHKIEKLCKKVTPKCWASDMMIPICASNGKVYKNPGVLMCAQVCDNSIEFELFCKVLKPDDSPNPKDPKACVNCPIFKQLETLATPTGNELSANEESIQNGTPS